MATVPKATTEETHVVYNRNEWKKSVLIGIPTLGTVRYEWAVARYSQIIPINWQLAEFAITYSPIGFLVHDAYNVIAEQAVKQGIEWLLTLEDDVLPPQDLFIKIRHYMESRRYPIVSGLYYTKGQPSEPLLFRGRGNGAFHDWKRGDRVMVDGIPMGCLLVHRSILQWCWDHAVPYTLPNGQPGRKVFDTPRRKWQDPETLNWQTQVGTQDLYWYDWLLKENVLKQTGWTRLAKERYPFLCDTSIFCTHIDRNTGRQYP